MQIDNTRLGGVKILRPRRINDLQGHFQESWNETQFSKAGMPSRFDHETQTFIRMAGTRRGLHYQAPPFAHERLIRVLTGEVLQVAVDARAGSKTYGEWTCAILNASNGRQMFIPVGCLHGFLTLAPETTLLSKTTQAHEAGSQGSIQATDGNLAIDWGMPEASILTDARDHGAQAFAEWHSPFVCRDFAA